MLRNNPHILFVYYDINLPPMQLHHKERYHYRTYMKPEETVIHSTAELLRMQSRGERLTHEEKNRVQIYAINKRKERLTQKR